MAEILRPGGAHEAEKQCDEALKKVDKATEPELRALEHLKAVYGAWAEGDEHMRVSRSEWAVDGKHEVSAQSAIEAYERCEAEASYFTRLASAGCAQPSEYACFAQE